MDTELQRDRQGEGEAISPSLLDEIRILLAGIDTVHLSLEQEVSEDMYYRLLEEQQRARDVRTERNAVYVSPWLNAEMRPGGANGFAFIIETPDFSVKVQRGNSHRPGIFIEMRSLALHQHSEGPCGACADAIAWIRDRLFDDVPSSIRQRIALGYEKLSRFDLHIDWQGGWHPTLEDGEERRFIRPAHVKWAPYMVDDTCTGMMFGRKRIVARIYNKTTETTNQHNTEYPKLVAQMAGDRYDPTQDIWRLEYELKREGIEGFVLKTRSEVYSDDDDEIEAEMEGEDLPTIGTLDKALHWMAHVFSYLTQRWLRLVEPNGDSNRARWPVHDTWKALQEGFSTASGATLEPEQVQLVREARHTGKRRLLETMGAGLATTAWMMVYSDPTQAVRAFYEQTERKARQMLAYQQEKRERSKQRLKPVEEIKYLESLKQLAAMAGGIYATIGVMGQRFPVVTDMTDVLCAVGEELEDIAKYKGGVQQMLFDKWCKTYKVLPPRKLFAQHAA